MEGRAGRKPTEPEPAVKADLVKSLLSDPDFSAGSRTLSSDTSDNPPSSLTADPPAAILSPVMAIERYESFSPDIPPSAFVAASADIIGRVTLGEESSVWHHATLRGDINCIVIGPRSNVQDNAVIHLADELGCHVGELVTVGHSAILHACTVKDEVLVGMGAIVLDGAVIGERSIIGAGALVTGGTVIPPGSLVLGSPAKVVRTLSLDEQVKVRTWADKYVVQSRKYLAR